jgi:penicillin V acylase-like amidase (Ntn superfamily)
MAVPAGQTHQLHDEYVPWGLVFSDEDADLRSTHRRFQPATTTYNVVRQGTLSNVFRVDLRHDNVAELKMIVVDTNLNDTIHKLTAFDAHGR